MTFIQAASSARRWRCADQGNMGRKSGRASCASALPSSIESASSAESYLQHVLKALVQRLPQAGVQCEAAHGIRLGLPDNDNDCFVIDLLTVFRSNFVVP